MIIGFGLMIWFIRLSRAMPAEYRPPFGLAGPFEFLRLDYYSDRGRTSIARAACAMALLSFVFVAAAGRVFSGSGRGQITIVQSRHTLPASWLSAQASTNLTPRAPSATLG